MAKLFRVLPDLAGALDISFGYVKVFDATLYAWKPEDKDEDDDAVRVSPSPLPLHIVCWNATRASLADRFRCTTFRPSDLQICIK